MERLPSLDERKWLTHALRKLIAKRGAAWLDGVPLVEPTDDWFPEGWSATAAHGHRLAQRLLSYAGLEELRPTLSAFDPSEDDEGNVPWDAGTAGWFAGITDGVAHFGLHVGQFRDPEVAAGVLAHEVAHAWRSHHHLMVEEREKEELLTDLTTVALGFGILSTNNTDRYRSSGTLDSTSWSVSSAGYLPPQAMAYLLALWSSARDVPGERKVIERHLEPNQLSFFRAALEELGKEETSPRERLGITSPPSPSPLVRPELFVPYDPQESEIEEPEYEDESQANRGEVVYRKAKGSPFDHFFVGACGGAVLGYFLAAVAGDIASRTIAVSAGIGAAIGAGLMSFRSRVEVCSECNTRILAGAALCSGCGGTVGRRVSERELVRIREEELDRAAAELPFEECSRCAPEEPCSRHR